MFVSTWMTRDPVTATPDMSVADAYQLMLDKSIRRLPVTEGEALVGIFTISDLQKLLFPEPHRKLARQVSSDHVVRQVMANSPLTVTPEMPVETAALMMEEHRIAGLPVVQNEKLVGIISERDIFRAMLRMMGTPRDGVRITFELKAETERFGDILEVCAKRQVTIQSVATLCGHRQHANMLMIRVKGLEVDELLGDLREGRHKILRID